MDERNDFVIGLILFLLAMGMLVLIATPILLIMLAIHLLRR